ncbi:hypothetical protein OAS39_11555 [Pirellulales bacterium]|nr:hypothetical protein [Pirellulales bacterium]
MTKFYVLAALLIGGVCSQSLVAESEVARDSASLVSGIEAGQMIKIKELGFGYSVSILSPSQIESLVSLAKTHLEEYERNRLHAVERGKKGIASKAHLSPREYFGEAYPTIDHIARDHLALKYSDGRERLISIRAVVEVIRKPDQ